jgi:membrane-associated protein
MFNIAGAAAWVMSLVTGGFFFGNIPVVRDHLTAIVLFGVGVAVVPLAIGGAVKLVRKMLQR